MSELKTANNFLQKTVITSQISIINQSSLNRYQSKVNRRQWNRKSWLLEPVCHINI